MTGSPPPAVIDQLKALCGALASLPPKNQSTGLKYPFENFVIDEEWLELTGSAQGSVNHTVKVIFGSQHNGQPLIFTSHGPNLLAVVDVFLAYITGSGGENSILIQWNSDLHKAATHPLKQNASLLTEDIKRNRKPTAKQAMLNQDASEKKKNKAKKCITNVGNQDAKVPELSPEEWEKEAELDEVIVIDLLSNEPVPGAITRGDTTTKKRSVPADTGLLVGEGPRKKFVPELFEF